ncbi:ABC transporter permease [Achromobacter sp. F4_2707]|uniref:ABC transporter permease n=1 Tax=Achromobacter sp. F4_2707 TaxID=3114286 RepID=UPI0039C5F04E
MTLAALLVQALNGLAEASSLFLVAVGLSLIFGVSRIVNFAHGSLYMLGLYLAWTLSQNWGGSVVGFWATMLAASLLIGVVGALVEMTVLRRIYRAPEMFQLLATFALVLVFEDLALWLWGPEDLLGPLAPGLEGSVPVLGRYFPVYDLVLIAIGPLVWLGLWLLLNRTHWGRQIRAATQDREMLGALGVNPAWLFTSVFALGAFLAGLAGALQLPRQPANLGLDLAVIGDAFVVVVVGGMGSISGAALAAVIIAQLKALCIALGVVEILGVQVAFPKLTLVVEFLFMAVVLVFRPWGLLGKPLTLPRAAAGAEAPLIPAGRMARALAVCVAVVALGLPLLSGVLPYATVIAQDMLIAVIFAVSLHFMMGLGGMVSFGHAAYFGLGAYGVALAFKSLGWGMAASLLAAPVLAGVAALLFGWFCVRLAGVYLAMLTLAFAQIVWSVVYQWDAVTGGSNGMIGVWPEPWLSGNAWYGFVAVVAIAVVWLVRRLAFSRFGLALRAVRDSALRADALGMDVRRVQLVGFVIAGVLAGVAGGLFVFSKGGVSPETLMVGTSVDALVMVLLGGVQQLAGPVVGGVAFTAMRDYFVGITEYWGALFGAVILLIVMVFPQGIAGQFARWSAARRPS